MSTRPVSRRAVLAALPCLALKADTGSWSKEWDSALRESALAGMEKSWDPAEQMVSAFHGPEYSYQSNIRNQRVHPTRNSLEYASLLLYRTDPASIERAAGILRRVLPLQVKDPESRYFGLWGWYMEEPPEKMPAADFNWADFNGATLLNILLEHESKLPAEVAAGCREALRDCAASIRKRNVGLDYTNIAFQGTYVTLATAELFRDAGLLAYAKDRMARLEKNVAVTGSFAEYNSPTYLAVTIGNISRILNYVQDEDARMSATRLNALAWKHVAEHWHAPTRQLAGPMSRAYSNNIGYPMWIQKGTDNRVVFVNLADIARQRPGGEVSIPTVAWRCPDEWIPLFTATTRHQHREIFSVGKGAKSLVEGTTLLTPVFSLGSINRSDCWIQRRNLIAYWGGQSRPPHCLQMRVMKDDYDFTSAIFYGAQEQGYVLGCIRFRLDGGDKHPSLDPVQDRTITLSRMRLVFLFEQWDAANRILVDGKRQTEKAFVAPAGSRIAIDAGSVKVLFRARQAGFLEKARNLRFGVDGSSATLSVELMESASAQTVRLTELSEPGCDFVFQMDDSGAAIERLDAAFAASPYSQSDAASVRKISWKTGSGDLSVRTSTAVLPIAQLDEAFYISM